MPEQLSSLRTEILLKLAYGSASTFSELRDEDIPSNKFSYHLKELEKDDYIEKKEEGYELTDKGEKYVAYLSEGGEERKQQPILGVILFVEKGGKVLMSTRKKEPFQGYSGLPHGRISMGEGIEEAAKRILSERTGLEAEEIEQKGRWVVNTFRGDDLLYTHYHFIVECRDISGELDKETKEFRNEWISRGSLDEMKRFEDNKHILEIAESYGFQTVKASRSKKGGEFRDLEIEHSESYQR